MAPVEEQDFLGGGETAAFNMTGVMKCLNPASKEVCRTIFICLNSVNVELREVSLREFRAAPDPALVLEDQQSTCR